MLTAGSSLCYQISNGFHYFHSTACPAMAAVGYKLGQGLSLGLRISQGIGLRLSLGLGLSIGLKGQVYGMRGCETNKYKLSNAIILNVGLYIYIYTHTHTHTADLLDGNSWSPVFVFV